MPAKAEWLLAECDHIVFAGDICGPDVLRAVQSIAPTTAVLGNNDFREYGKSVDRFGYVVLDGMLFTVTHYPHKILPLTQQLLQTPEFKDFQGEVVAVHGHTHIPEIEKEVPASIANYLICPGALNYPRTRFGETLAFAEISNGKVLDLWLSNLDGNRVIS